MVSDKCSILALVVLLCSFVSQFFFACLSGFFFFCLVLCNLYSTLSGSYREAVASRWHWQLNLHLIFINKSSWKITLYVPKKWNQRRRHSQPYTTFPLFHCYTRITQYFLFKCALSEIFPEVCIIFFMLTGRKKKYIPWHHILLLFFLHSETVSVSFPFSSSEQRYHPDYCITRHLKRRTFSYLREK